METAAPVAVLNHFVLRGRRRPTRTDPDLLQARATPSAFLYCGQSSMIYQITNQCPGLFQRDPIEDARPLKSKSRPSFPIFDQTSVRPCSPMASPRSELRAGCQRGSISPQTARNPADQKLIVRLNLEMDQMTAALQSPPPHTPHPHQPAHPPTPPQNTETPPRTSPPSPHPTNSPPKKKNQTTHLPPLPPSTRPLPPPPPKPPRPSPLPPNPKNPLVSRAPTPPPHPPPPPNPPTPKPKPPPPRTANPKPQTPKPRSSFHLGI